MTRSDSEPHTFTMDYCSYPAYLRGPFGLQMDDSSPAESDTQPQSQPEPLPPSPRLRPSRLPPLSCPDPQTVVALPLQELTPSSDPDHSPWRPRPAPRITAQGVRKLQKLSAKITAVCRRPAAWRPRPVFDVSKLRSPLRRLVSLADEETFSICRRTRSQTGAPVRKKAKWSRS